MHGLAIQVGANRVIKGVGIPYPCGNPELSPEEDFQLRRDIVYRALRALSQEAVGVA